MENWLRNYKIIIGKEGQTGFQLGGKAKGQNLHVSFSIEKTDDTANNSASMKIWNLSDEHINMLSEDGVKVEIRAGYDENLATVYYGDVVEVIESLDDSDRLVEVELSEGAKDFQSYTSFSMQGMIPCSSVLGKFINEIGSPSVVYSAGARELINNVKYGNGYSYVGRTKDGFSAVLTKCGLTWSMQNGVIQIYKLGESITTKAFLLTADTGLIETPKRIVLNAKGQVVSDAKKKKEAGNTKGYEITYLMNGAIGINDLVYVRTRKIDGTYRVKNVQIDGDNFDGDWVCTAQVVEV